MPLTPLHLGPGLLLGVLTLRFFNLWAILLGSVVMDIEPTYLIFVKKCYSCPHHGFFHSILGAFFGSLILSFLIWIFRTKLNQLSLRLKISQLFSLPVLFFSSLSAWLIHIFFDSLTHYDVFLLWPLKYNPILIGPEFYWPLTALFLILGIFGFFFLFRKIAKPK